MFSLPSLDTIKLILAALLIVGAAAGSAYIMHRVDLATLEKVELGYEAAQTKAVQVAKVEQAAQDQLALNSAVAEAAAQQKIVTITKEVPIHVKETVSCITYGIVRVLDAAVSGRDPSTLNLPTGKSDDDCAPISVRALAAIVVGNYTDGLRNAEQLNQLETFLHGATGK